MCVCVCLYVIFKVPTFYDHLHSFPTKKNPKKRKKENQKPKTNHYHFQYNIQTIQMKILNYSL